MLQQLPGYIMPPRSLSLALLLLAATACTKAQDTTTQALDTVGNETSASYNKIRDDLDLGSKPKPKPQPKAQPRYCYHTYEDVICYSKPLPGEEYRLTGFQTSTGKSGYTMDPEVIPGDDLDAEPPPLKSVTVPPPPAVKGTGDTQLKEVIFDPAELQPRELVPDKPQ